jgi:site-specific DNA-methyltransferase (adenine-specific)
MEKNKIYQGDCLEVMKDIPDKSIDMILCDLPYGTTACKWDTIIPFEPLWEQYKRIIKDNGAIVLTASQPFTSALVMSNPDMFRESIVWLKNKAGSGLQADQKHIKVHEDILVFSLKGRYKFNPQKWLVDKKEFLTQRKTLNTLKVGNTIYSEMMKTQTKDDGTRNPISIVSTKVPHNPSITKTYSKDIDLRLHPTQKPVVLFEYLIKTYTNEGDLVLDNCAGSGTTGVACKNLNRNYILIEKEPEYIDIINKRLTQDTNPKE